MMRSTFYGLEIGNKGLFVSQRQVDVTGHNISNTNTVGYSRQRFITEAIPPPGYAAQFASTSTGRVGAGTDTMTLDQIRDIYLDRQFRQEQSKSNYWEQKANALYYIEDVFNGDYDANLAGIFGKFFNSVQELTKNPTDEAIRTNMIQESKKMMDVMHLYYQQLEDLMYEQDYALKTEAGTVSEIAAKIAALNDNILKYELGGQPANDLRDHRNLLVDQLSSLVDVTYEEVGTGKYNIYGVELTTMNVAIGPALGMDRAELFEDYWLVAHTRYRKLLSEQTDDIENSMIASLEETGDLDDEGYLHRVGLSEAVYDVVTKVIEGDENVIDSVLNLGIEYGATGRLSGYVDIRDGGAADNQGIPYFVDRLNQFTKALVETFNSVHMQGWSMPYTNSEGEEFDSVSGIPYFDEAGILARTIALSEDIIASAFNVSASSQEVLREADVNGRWHYNTGNNEIALKLIKEVKESNEIEVIGSFEGFYMSFISEMAAEVSHSNQMKLAEQILVDSLDNQRLSIMGVSIDEEMTNLIRFQHAYNASARTITSMDDLLETLIHRTGRCGL
ncbi:MAG: flagellar hook-associated protein FlgK [Oscillospiraceae bacterium]|nr:flagellar hook-associated protein FlgK [Oscillospiraceae bacterium]